MLVTAEPRRDPFAFSLGGMAGINSYTLVPAIPDNRINQSLDAKFRQAPAQTEPSPLTLKIENALARFFAAGFCRQT